MMLFLVLLGIFQLSLCHEAFMGSCPKIEPMEDFDMERFQGLWYVIDLFEKGVKCMSWNFFMENNQTWKIYETRQSGVLHSLGFDSTSATTATITPKEELGTFVVSWPTNIAGSYDLTVIHTDYDLYAGIFSCQGLLIGHRQQALVLSRKPFLQQQYRQIIKGKLNKFKVEPYYFHKVDQTRCGYEGEEAEKPQNYGPLGRGISADDESNDEGDYEGGDDETIPRRWFGDYNY